MRRVREKESERGERERKREIETKRRGGEQTELSRDLFLVGVLLKRNAASFFIKETPRLVKRNAVT